MHSTRLDLGLLNKLTDALSFRFARSAEATSEMSGGGSSGAGVGGEAEVSSAVLSAPPGWTKKVTTPLKGTPKRKEIIFVAPTGEELNSKKQVEKYLKSHPGGPELSEFYWGSGETPRRSSRLGVKTKEVDTPESEPPKKRSRKSSEKKGDGTETETDLKVKQGGDGTETEAGLEVKQGGDGTETEADLEVKHVGDVQMHDAEAAVTEVAVAEVKVVDAQETPELNNIDDLRAPVAPSVEADVVKEATHNETKKDDTVAGGDKEEILISESMPLSGDDTAAGGDKEEIPNSEPMPLSGDTEVAVNDNTENGKAPEAPQVKVDINVQGDAANEQQQVKVDCPEEVVGEKDVGWTREIQVEDGSSPPPTSFVEKVGPVSEAAATDTPKVDGEVKSQPSQQKYTIDLEQLPAP